MNIKEEVRIILGEYTATIMQENPTWVFDARRAVELVDEIDKLYMEYFLSQVETFIKRRE